MVFNEIEFNSLYSDKGNLLNSENNVQTSDSPFREDLLSGISDEQKENAEHESTVKSTKLIWFIDDDLINNLLSDRLMKKYHPDFNCRTFNGAEEPLEYLKSAEHGIPYAIFLDINMPRMSGWDFLDEFLAVLPKTRVKVFMLSSSIDPQDHEKARNYFAVKEFISKPLREERLRGLLA